MADASTEPQYPLNDAQSDKLRRQLNVWRNQLIAMNRSQRQVYFKHTRSASLELIAPAPDVIAGLIDSGSTRLFSMVPDSSTPSLKSRNRHSMGAQGGLVLDGLAPRPPPRATTPTTPVAESKSG